MTDIELIREAVEKLKAGCSTSDFFAALYELDTFNPAPVVNQQLTTAPVLDAKSHAARRMLDAVKVAPAHSDHPLRHWDRSCPACNPDDPMKEKIK